MSTSSIFAVDCILPRASAVVFNAAQGKLIISYGIDFNAMTREKSLVGRLELSKPVDYVN